VEANPGDDWATQQPRRRRARRAHHAITRWEHCFNDNCNEHRWEKVNTGYYPQQLGGKEELSKNDRQENKKRRAVRTRLAGEGSEKLFRTEKLWKIQSGTYEANSIAQRKPSSQRTTTSNDSIRKRKNSHKPTIEPNRGCTKSGVCCGRKEFNLVGPMQEREGS